MPTFAERIKHALHVFRHGYPSEELRLARRFPQHTRAAPYRWPDYIVDNPALADIDAYYDSWVNEGYEGNSLIYSALMYKMRSVTQAPMRAYLADGKLAPPEHPLAQLAARPNPYMSGKQFMMYGTGYLSLAGNFYYMLDRDTDGSVTALWPMRPDRVKILAKMSGPTAELVGYLYVPQGKGARGGIPMLHQDVGHVRLPNLKDPLEGLGAGTSPILPLAMSGDVDNAISRYLREFFKRGTMLAGVLTFDFELDDEQVARVKQRWQEQYGGVENWDEIGVLDVNAKYQQLGMGFNEMGFEALDERTEGRILGPFGVPPILVGSRMGLMRSTYSNYKEARAAFWEDTMLFEIGLHEDEMRHYVQTDDGAYIKADHSDVPALQRNTSELVQSWAALMDRGVPSATAAETVGLDLPAYAGDQVGFIPAGWQPFSTSLDGDGNPATALPDPAMEPGENNPDQPASEATEEEREERGAGAGEKKAVTLSEISIIQDRLFSYKQIQYRRVDTTAQSWESQWREATLSAWQNERRHIASLIRRGEHSRQHQVDFSWVMDNVNFYLVGTESNENWRNEFNPLLEGVIGEQGAAWALELGRQWDIANVRGADWFLNYQMKFSNPISNTTQDALRSLFAQGQLEGWSITTTMDRLNDLYEVWSLMPDEYPGVLEALEFMEPRLRLPRLEAIARTETMRASNYGNHHLFMDWRVPAKEWLATFDQRTRPSHMAAWADYHFGGNIGPIPMTQAFNVGGYPMMHPHDANGPAGEVVNCRCTELPFSPESVT